MTRRYFEGPVSSEPPTHIEDATALSRLSDSVDLPFIARGLYATVAGNAVIITQDGDTVTIPLSANVRFDVWFSRLKSTSTTATGIKIIY